jgi:hypothetical protein
VRGALTDCTVLGAWELADRAPLTRRFAATSTPRGEAYEEGESGKQPLRRRPHLVYDTGIMTRAIDILSNTAGLNSLDCARLPLLLLRLTRP